MATAAKEPLLSEPPSDSNIVVTNIPENEPIVSDSEDQKSLVSKQKVLEHLQLLEEVYSTTVQIILVDFAWANAAITSSAILYSIKRNPLDNYAGAWIYFGISCACAILFGFLPRACQNVGFVSLHKKVDSVHVSLQNTKANEPDLTNSMSVYFFVTIPVCTKDKGFKNDRIKSCEFCALKKKKRETDKKSLTSRNSRRVIIKALEATGAHTDEVTRNLVTLTIAVFGLIVAFSLSNLTQMTVEKGFKSKDDESFSLGMLWTYAVLMFLAGSFFFFFWKGHFQSLSLTFFYIDIGGGGGNTKGIFSITKLSKYVEDANGEELTKAVDQPEYLELRNDLLTLSHSMRCFRLYSVAVALCMAWAIRDAMSYTIVRIFYGTYQRREGNRRAMVALWIYVLLLSSIVAWKGYVSQQKLDLTKFSRRETQLIAYMTFNVLQTVIVKYDNIFEIGLAIYDAIIASCEHGRTNDLRLSVYWAVVVACITTSVIGTFYLKKRNLESNSSTEETEAQQTHSSQITSKRKEYGKKWLELWVSSLVLYYVRLLISMDEKKQNTLNITLGSPNGANNSEVLSLWLSVFISYLVSALIITYLSKSMDAFKEKRKNFADSLIADQNQQNTDQSPNEQNTDQPSNEQSQIKCKDKKTQPRKVYKLIIYFMKSLSLVFVTLITNICNLLLKKN
ncbi:hypothetical protein RFI_15159 [Reticulomyxa filosa]|uniref:Uncharacterized protein n=1 Tax=Reticulomyxa filosa TaxID=46433 RepID=X6N7M4_RETFI|nr:hypothetical protein RFI_15159 [Reticulomyxa filosa]|eukprot:ETO22046.1 hypothetical protein RFI_15159 [Reticulomyxa filosa]